MEEGKNNFKIIKNNQFFLSIGKIENRKNKLLKSVIL